jgi:hypothetical protein
MLFVIVYSSFSQKCKSTYIILYTLYGCGASCKIGLRMKIHIQVTWVLRLDVSKSGFVCANVCANFT